MADPRQTDITAAERQRLERYFEVLLYYVGVFVLIISYLPIGVVVDHRVINIMVMLAVIIGIVSYRLLPPESSGPIKYNFEQKSLIIGSSDILFASIILAASGGSYSPFLFLYVFPILAAALLLRQVHIYIEMSVFVLSLFGATYLLGSSALNYRIFADLILILMSFLLVLVLVNDRLKRVSALRSAQDKLMNINVLLSDQVKSIQEKNKYLEDVKNATLNILEDLEVEKNKALTSANDALKFKQAAEASKDAIIILTPDGVIQYVNPSWTRITEYMPEESLGKKITFVHSPKAPKKVVDTLLQAFASGQSFQTEELTHQRKDGSEFEARITLYPIKADNQPLLFVTTLEDITERKSIERQKSEFISVASHQLRTPLSAMNWFLEMLSNGEVGPVNEKQRDYLEQVSQSNKRLIILVNDLLNVSRLETGRTAFEISSVNVPDLINSLTKEYYPLAEAKNLKFIITASSDLPLIESDQEKLRQVIGNFLSNAIKYTKGKGEITIAAEKAGESVKISVIDQGVGIPKSQQISVFSKFFRGDNVIRLQTEGTGLGLYIAKIIIESLGGAIGFTSQENAGSTFWVSLPIKYAKIEAKKPEAI